MSEANHTPQQSYISRVRLKGYKSIVDTEVELKPGLNIIIGPNGSGKTNFVEFLSKVLERKIIEDTIYYAAEITFSGIVEEEVIYFSEYKITPKKGIIGDKSQGIRQEYLQINGQKQEIKDTELVNNIFDNIPFTPTYLSYGVKDEFAVLKSTTKIEVVMQEAKFYTIKTDPTISKGLQSLLLSLLLPTERLNHFVTLDDIIDEMVTKLHFFKRFLQAYTPINDIKINKSLENSSEGNTLLLDYIKLDFYINNNWLTWNQLSDGTKRLFYIITEITFANNVILLEEPELGIHPHQLSRLMDFIKEQSESKQIILTTHSPQVLNILDPDDLDRIIISRYDKEKGTQLHHLTEEEIRHARSYMEAEGLFLSDFWVYSGFEREEEQV